MRLLRLLTAGATAGNKFLFIFWTVSSAGRALPLQGRCHKFKSCTVHQRESKGPRQIFQGAVFFDFFDWADYQRASQNRRVILFDRNTSRIPEAGGRGVFLWQLKSSAKKPSKACRPRNADTAFPTAMACASTSTPRVRTAPSAGNRGSPSREKKFASVLARGLASPWIKHGSSMPRTALKLPLAATPETSGSLKWLTWQDKKPRLF